jgi:hypothetical protein
MAHFAEIDENNKVVRVIVVNNNDILDENGYESEAIGVAFCQRILGNHNIWKQCSYNNNFRKHYPSVGHNYDSTRDYFYQDQPYASWTFNTETAEWEAPVERPDDRPYDWDESTRSWVLQEGWWESHQTT